MTLHSHVRPSYTGLYPQTNRSFTRIQPQFSSCLPRSAGACQVRVNNPLSSHRTYPLISLRKSTPPSKSSTLCLLLLIQTLSWWICGGVDFPKPINECNVRDDFGGAAAARKPRLQRATLELTSRLVDPVYASGSR